MAGGSPAGQAVLEGEHLIRASDLSAPSRAPVPRARALAFRSRRGFTLLELVIVVAILATLAGLAIAHYGGDDGVEARAHLDLAQTELATLQRALVQLHRDTGSLPGTGPFGVVSDTLGVPAAGLPKFVRDATSDPALQEKWLRHPANLWPLFVNPFADPDAGGPLLPHPLSVWNPVTRRGWSGPYLPLAAAGLCAAPQIPTGWTGRGAWSMGTPLGASLPLYALHDPFMPGPNSPFTWSDFSGTSLEHSPGLPYLLLDATEQPTNPGDTLRARVVSLGPDGAYGKDFPDAFTDAGSLVVTDPTSDDLGRFVHR